MKKIIGIALLLLAALFLLVGFASSGSAMAAWLVLGIVFAILGLRVMRKKPKSEAPATIPVSSAVPDTVPAPVSQPTEATEANASKPLQAPSEIDRCYPAYDYDDVVILPTEGLQFSAIRFDVPLILSKSPDSIIVSQDGMQLGSLPSTRLAGMASDWITRGDPVFARIMSVDPVASSITIGLTFYKDLLAEAKRRGLKAITLTNTGSTEIQEALGLTSSGELCEAEWDYDKEKWEITSGMTVGYLPAKFKEDAISDKNRIVVADVEMNNNLKYVISVYIL